MGERKISFDVLLVALSREGSLTQATHALCVLTTVQVSFTLFPTKNTSAARHLKSCGDAFSCFSFSSNSCHSGRILISNKPNATEITTLFPLQTLSQWDFRKFPPQKAGRETGLSAGFIWFTPGTLPATFATQI